MVYYFSPFNAAEWSKFIADATFIPHKVRYGFAAIQNGIRAKVLIETIKKDTSVFGMLAGVVDLHGANLTRKGDRELRCAVWKTAVLYSVVASVALVKSYLCWRSGVIYVGYVLVNVIYLLAVTKFAITNMTVNDLQNIVSILISLRGMLEIAKSSIENIIFTCRQRLSMEMGGLQNLAFRRKQRLRREKKEKRRKLKISASANGAGSKRPRET
jgi:hypothetical protein